MNDFDNIFHYFFFSLEIFPDIFSINMHKYLKINI